MKPTIENAKVERRWTEQEFSVWWDLFSRRIVGADSPFIRSEENAVAARLIADKGLEVWREQRRNVMPAETRGY